MTSAHETIKADPSPIRHANHNTEHPTRKIPNIARNRRSKPAIRILYGQIFPSGSILLLNCLNHRNNFCSCFMFASSSWKCFLFIVIDAKDRSQPMAVLDGINPRSKQARHRSVAQSYPPRCCLSAIRPAEIMQF